MKYSHGGNIRKAAGTYKIDESTIIDFSANINPLGMSPMAEEAITQAMGTIINYPDPDSSHLVNALSEYHHIPSENILTGNGATELIYLVPRALKFKSALIMTPAFSEYERALALSGCKVELFRLSPDNNFRLNMDDILAAIKMGCDSLWIGSPANPTGMIIPANDVLKIADEASSLGITLIVDEAFIDFCEEESVKEAVKDRPNLIVLRSMTKFFALAGLRIGYLFAHQKIISQMRGYKEPWTLNSLAEAAAVASLKDRTYRKNTKMLIEGEREFLLKELKTHRSIEIYESHTNYLLLRLEKDWTSAKLQDELLKKHKVFIRDCSNYAGLDKYFVRTAVKSRDDNKLLIDALGKILN